VLEFLQLPVDARQEVFGKAGPNSAGEHKSVRTIVADQQRAKVFPASFRQRKAADNKRSETKSRLQIDQPLVAAGLERVHLCSPQLQSHRPVCQRFRVRIAAPVSILTFNRLMSRQCQITPA
jgi:hypothetical protein